MNQSDYDLFNRNCLGDGWGGYTLTYPYQYKCPNCKCKNCSPKIYSKEELEEAIKKAVEEYVNKTSKEG